MNFNRHRADPILLYTPENPQFFKVILPRAVEEGKLAIPKTFITKYGASLSDQVTLKVLPDVVWNIGLTRSDGYVWLEDGLKEFIDHYSLAYGYFLIFKCKGNSHFSVTICDQSGSEISYPYAITHAEEETETETEEPDDNVSLVMRGQNSDRGFRKRLKSRLPSQINGDTSGILKSIRDKIRKKRTLTFEDKQVCLQNAGKFESAYPHFMIVIQPAFLRSQGVMTIPTSFAREYMNQKKDSVTLIKDCGGKTWIATYYCGTSYLNGRLNNGWLSFACDNKLEIGDVCAFELVKQNETVLRVSIFKFLECCEADSSKIKEEKVTNLVEGEKSEATVKDIEIELVEVPAKPGDIRVLELIICVVEVVCYLEISTTSIAVVLALVSLVLFVCCKTD
ncbi:hypothetical protein ACFE04_022162 [Oxalis oulophora]